MSTTVSVNDVQRHMLNGLVKCGIPGYMHEGLICYVLQGRPVGNFLTAVLAGDLFEALRRADDTNIRLLREYGMFLFNYVPAACFGSPEKHRSWLAAGGLLGLAAARPEATGGSQR